MASAKDGIHTDFSEDMSYGDYLRLETLLSAQVPLSGEHDELLFIVIHQVMELWLKLLNRELDTALDHVRAGQLQPAFKCLARINRIQEQLIQAWTVLSTMTPSDYLRFRPSLGRSSGFQSWQYRLVEFKLGAKDASKIAPHRQRGELPVCTMRLCACSPRADIPSPRRFSTVMSRALTLQTLASRRPGRRSIGIRMSTSISMNSRRSWWTLKMRSSNGVSGT
jgi:tryptophan 2,3-dioxygenase